MSGAPEDAGSEADREGPANSSAGCVIPVRRLAPVPVFAGRVADGQPAAARGRNRLPRIAHAEPQLLCGQRGAALRSAAGSEEPAAAETRSKPERGHSAAPQRLAKHARALQKASLRFQLRPDTFRTQSGRSAPSNDAHCQDAHSVAITNGDQFEFIAALPSSFCVHIRSPIMLLRNLDPPQLCNGTLLSVKKLMPNVIEATVLTGKAKGKDVFIPRIPLIPTDLPFTFKRLQFPVRLAFAMTINKAQGQSLKFAGINLENSCFSHVQIPSELNQEEVLHPMMPIARMRIASQSQTVTSLNSSLHYLHHFACTLARHHGKDEARSPDLAPCNDFLWGHLKAEVFKHQPRTLPDLRNAIQEETGLIPQKMLVRVMQNFRSRIQQCIDSEGHHLRDTLFKK
ncbi:hypothetical protein ANN_21830 [Periplaneta americana]|uniref:DNA helicase Pif1-like 2B domain-containing protein n=1 Tax=Periplaneta americana TaxID=6978 RepID=A0ABQ8S6F8_PERAM|nr:hypothetical protein ANN_21830 [Periplaneta americana]